MMIWGLKGKPHLKKKVEKVSWNEIGVAFLKLRLCCSWVCTQVTYYTSLGETYLQQNKLFSLSLTLSLTLLLCCVLSLFHFSLSIPGSSVLPLFSPIQYLTIVFSLCFRSLPPSLSLSLFLSLSLSLCPILSISFSLSVSFSSFLSVSFSSFLSIYRSLPSYLFSLSMCCLNV